MRRRRVKLSKVKLKPKEKRPSDDIRLDAQVINGKTRNEWEAVWGEAHIGPHWYPKKLIDYDDAGGQLQDFIFNDEFHDKAELGIGIYIHVPRGKFGVLQTFAKELCIMDTKVVVTSLTRLLDDVMVAKPQKYARISEGGYITNMRHLCVFNFQENGDNPYSRQQIVDLQDFFIERMNWNMPLYVEAAVSLDNANWWDERFRDFLREKTQEYSIVQ